MGNIPYISSISGQRLCNPYRRFLVPNRDYLSFHVNTPKNQYTLDVLYAILDYDSRAGISGHGMNIEKMETLREELAEMTMIVGEDLKDEMTDSKVKEIMEKLKELERQIVEILK